MDVNIGIMCAGALCGSGGGLRVMRKEEVLDGGRDCGWGLNCEWAWEGDEWVLERDEEREWERPSGGGICEFGGWD